MKRFRKVISLILILSVISGCSTGVDKSVSSGETKSDYGVFLSAEGSDAINASKGYGTAVIDAQYLSKEEIELMQARDQKVYSYINIGSLETFRPYYEDYKELKLKAYKNWNEESWVDVTSDDWQNFIKDILVKELLEKKVDGFWVDNVDVYGQFPTKQTYQAIEMILKDLNTYNKAVIINGGDEFVQLYLENNKQVDDILTGVNQETVFSSINFDNKTFGIQTSDDQDYYLEYLDSIDKLQKDIFLLEYTTDKNLISKIETYAKEREWEVYISDSIELSGK